MKKQKQTKVKKGKLRKTRIPCPDCGSALLCRADGTLYCKQCGKDRAIPEDLRGKLWRDTLPKPGRLLLIVLTALLLAGTVWLILINRPEPDLNDTMLDAALAERGAKTGKLTVSLVWDTVDDLDLHVITPDGEEIAFDNRKAGGGELDVDSNRSVDELSEVPVENISSASPAKGKYIIRVCEFLDRTPERSTNYYVRIRAGEREETFRGTIDTDGTIIELAAVPYDE